MGRDEDRVVKDDEVNERFRFIVGDEDEGKRLDHFLVEKAFAPSRSYIQNLIKEGAVMVSGGRVKPSYKISPGEVVEVMLPQPKEVSVEPEPIPLDVIYEDEDLIVINKPRGMVVHPAAGNYSGTLVNALLWHCQDLSGINGELRPGIVHRLDKDTSGVIVAAKNDMAHISLARQIKEKEATRRYIALVHGCPRERKGVIDAPLGRHPVHRKKIAVVKEGGRRAITHFEVLEVFKGYSLIWALLETGRTHQIRVHMAYIGHPVAGDPTYGGRAGELGLEGQALHAELLRFRHPRSGDVMEFWAPMPRDMVEAIERARRGSGGYKG